MKGLSSIILGTVLCLSSVSAFAKHHNNHESKDSHQWTCTTNASSSDVQADKDADEKMKTKAGSAMDSFKFAKKHCRDCTQITCDVK